MRLLLLLAVVSVEINQRENVHLPLGSVLSVRRPALVASHLAGRFTSEVLCGRVGVSKIGHVWVSCRHESEEHRWFSFLLRKFSRKKLHFPSAGLNNNNKEDF